MIADRNMTGSHGQWTIGQYLKVVKQSSPQIKLGVGVYENMVCLNVNFKFPRSVKSWAYIRLLVKLVNRFYVLFKLVASYIRFEFGTSTCA